MIAIAKVA